MTDDNGATVPSSAREQILGRVGNLEEREATMLGINGPIKVLVRELTGEQAQDFEYAVARGRPTALGMVLQMSIVDPVDGKLMFEPGDRENLQKLGFAGLKPVLELATELSGLSAEDIEKAKQSLLSGPPDA